MKILFTIILILILILVSFFVVRFIKLGKQSQDMKPTLGLNNGTLQGCGEKPNCVSCFAKDNEKQIDPITITHPKIEFITKLKKIISDQPSAKIISETENYLHIEFKSQLFGFIDDVEFHFPEDKLFMRSASRVGYSDMGQNRKRLEMIREKLTQ